MGTLVDWFVDDEPLRGIAGDEARSQSGATGVPRAGSGEQTTVAGFARIQLVEPDKRLNPCAIQLRSEEHQLGPIATACSATCRPVGSRGFPCRRPGSTSDTGFLPSHARSSSAPGGQSSPGPFWMSYSSSVFQCPQTVPMRALNRSALGDLRSAVSAGSETRAERLERLTRAERFC